MGPISRGAQRISRDEDISLFWIVFSMWLAHILATPPLSWSLFPNLKILHELIHMDVKITEKSKQNAVSNELLEWPSLQEQANNTCVSNGRKLYFRV